MKTLNIALVNKATIDIGVDMSDLAKALQLQVTRDFAPAWQTDVNLVLLNDASDNFDSLIILNDPDQAGALGYHDKSPNGFGYGKVFAKTTIQAGDPVSTVVSHELLEMLGNEHVDQLAKNPRNGWTYAVETADACQAESYQVAGVALSNFLYPAAFDANAPANAKFDHLGNIKAAFSINPGGYSNVMINNKWQQIFGSVQAAEKYFAKDHDRSPKIIAEPVKAFAAARFFNASKFPVIKAY